jgi:predicted DNA-binding transcriptional regulator
MSEHAPNPEVVYSKNTPLERIFRNATARVLDFLIVQQGLDYSPAEISRITEIPLRTVQKVIPHLLQRGLIKSNRSVGNTTMYVLNPESRTAKVLRQLIISEVNEDIDNTQREHQRTKRLKEKLNSP